MGDDELAARMVDTTVSAGDKNKPLAAPRSASMAADINNKSAVVANKAREMKNKATGFLSKALGRFGKAEKADESNLEETSGAFNAARREYDPSLFAEIRDGWVRRHMAARADDSARIDLREAAHPDLLPAATLAQQATRYSKFCVDAQTSN